ncbi:MAG TPA: VCBS repeat-containing protein [Pyrinomonadaceae bacterium]|nr:VCBS repeat-containing protein [Pyrinomonadaceae bacterium]
MRNILTICGKLSVLFACVLVLTVSSFAQLSLRKALDVDNDGKADFTVFRPSNANWYTLKSTGGFVFQPFGSANEDYMAPGDFDGDGKGDVSVWRDTNGGWYRMNSSNNTFAAVNFGSTGDEPVARDYDGDGKTDVGVVRRSNGAMLWYILKSSDGTLIASQFGLSTDFTAPGDYNGDGKFDLAVQRPGATATSQANFYALNWTNGALIVATSWGLSNDLVVPGDYDGDGKTDIAVVREGATSATPLGWYILQSSNGALKAANFGNTGTDLNVQNDYDGDGKTDIAVWRDSTSTFYVLKSLDNGLIVTPWGSPSDFPVASYDTH